MEFFDLTTLDVEPHAPRILRSDKGAARAIAINLPAGEQLQEHEVHEHAWLIVADGEVELRDGSPSAQRVGPGGVAHFDPHERHEVTAIGDARLLLVLAPWPGPGHPGAQD